MNYVKIAQTVVRLIEKNGRTILLQKLSGNAINVAKPWKGPGVPEVDFEVTTKGVFVPSSGESLGTQFINDELLARCNEVVLVAPNQIDLSIVNSLEDDTGIFAVQWVYALRPADLVMLYAFGLMR